MGRTLEGLQNTSVQIACEEYLVDLEYADDIVLVFEEEKALAFLNELTKVTPPFGWGPRDPHCAWLYTLQDMAANRCQWRSCCQFYTDCLNECLEVLSNKSWLYGSEASVWNTDVMLSMMMMWGKAGCSRKRIAGIYNCFVTNSVDESVQELNLNIPIQA
ncbi:hypothetical protein CLF_108468 [Clonorchis sinensis]|uniref:Reverse transcriptase domain-containing protein n=1 Tax=Clonorchis sinensis TaxID=79923 RepID=G7YI39_CLOSI|nr:hypothetical protein CLF_108468 [Clonorchis sinensis]